MSERCDMIRWNLSYVKEEKFRNQISTYSRTARALLEPISLDRFQFFFAVHTKRTQLMYQAVWEKLSEKLKTWASFVICGTICGFCLDYRFENSGKKLCASAANFSREKFITPRAVNNSSFSRYLRVVSGLNG